MNSKVKQRILIISAVIILIGIIIVIVLLNQNKDDSVKIGYVMTGSIDEGGWNGMNYKGISAVCNEYDVELIVKENILEGHNMCSGVVDELAKSGAELIFLSSFGYPGEVKDIIDKYPEISFYGISSQYYSDNMSSYFGRMYQARYLSGIIAGMMTKSNTIGYVAAMPNDEVNRGINAFTLGVRRVNPDAYVNVIFTDSWDDEQKAKNSAKALIENGADVLTYHQNQPYVIEVAEENGVYSIGYNEAQTGLSDKYLTAAVWNWELLYKDIVKDFLQGKANSMTHHWCGIETGAVGLYELSPLVTEQIKAEVEIAKNEIISGKDVFSGEIYDNEGMLRCEKDEFISDSALMKDFNWYVDGVVIYE